MIKISFLMDQENFDPYTLEVTKDILTDTRGFGAYRSLIVDSIKVEKVTDEEVKQEYNDSH
jgi:hypothetical protein